VLVERFVGSEVWFGGREDSRDVHCGVAVSLISSKEALICEQLCFTSVLKFQPASIIPIGRDGDNLNVMTVILWGLQILVVGLRLNCGRATTFRKWGCTDQLYKKENLGM